jgi:hypothetical protein
MWDAKTCEAAAESGNLACLKFVSLFSFIQIYYVNLILLILFRYAHKNGCNWDTSVCTAAASKAQIECLTYANYYHFSHSLSSLSFFALILVLLNIPPSLPNFRLTATRYAHENGCKWDSSTCTAVARGAHSHLQYPIFLSTALFSLSSLYPSRSSRSLLALFSLSLSPINYLLTFSFYMKRIKTRYPYPTYEIDTHFKCLK